MEQELESIQKFYQVVIEFFLNYGFQVLGALIIIAAGWFISRWAAKAVLRLCEKHDVDVTLGIFFSNVVRLLIIAAVMVVSLGKFGISIGLRYWAPTKRYFETQYRVNMALYHAVKDAGITIPYPHRDVRMIAASGG